jgi:lysyl-tRNA synthetase class I
MMKRFVVDPKVVKAFEDYKKQGKNVAINFSVDEYVRIFETLNKLMDKVESLETQVSDHIFGEPAQ